MGRKIRSVPKGWEHPKDADGRYIPLFDQDYEEAAEEYEQAEIRWDNGDDPDREGSECHYYSEWAGDPPHRADYRNYESEPVCYQVYETVSEGTPTSPVFESLDDLEKWLLAEGYDPKATKKFIESKYAPTFLVKVFSDGLSIIGEGIESLALD